MDAEFSAAAEAILAVVKGHKTHVSYCAQWGVDFAELESTLESPASAAYGAYIMDVGMQGAFKDLPFSVRLSIRKFMCSKEMLQAF